MILEKTPISKIDKSIKYVAVNMNYTKLYVLSDEDLENFDWYKLFSIDEIKRVYEFIETTRCIKPKIYDRMVTKEFEL